MDQKRPFSDRQLRKCAEAFQGLDTAWAALDALSDLLPPGPERAVVDDLSGRARGVLDGVRTLHRAQLPESSTYSFSDEESEQ